MDDRIYYNMGIKNVYLSDYASKDEMAHYFVPCKSDIRGNFYHDIDKILYSLAFTRYVDKTQVFSYNSNSHVSKRITHVLYVSKIARTIGRALNLNEDLIEAIALGHDLGHVPFGHVGEKILNDISIKHGVGAFNHNIHSVRTLMYVENYGRGLNVSMEVLDGIMCHNGEEEISLLEPKKKTLEEFMNEFKDSYINPSLMKKYVAGSLEGVVVRFSDLIGYLGRDIDDAVRLGLVSRDDIPESVKSILGNTTSSIVNSVIMDIINNSVNKPYIKLSDDVFNAISELKRFNYEHIYNLANTLDDVKLYIDMFNKLFDKYLNDIKTYNESSPIIFSYLKNMSNEYKGINSSEQIVIDYLAGMTDEFIKSEYNKIN